MDQENILMETQVGFRMGHSTIRLCLVLHHLVENTSKPHGELYVAFIDFKAAFCSIPRHSLRAKLQNSTVDRILYILICTLYESNFLLVRYSPQGRLSSRVEADPPEGIGCSFFHK